MSLRSGPRSPPVTHSLKQHNRHISRLPQHAGQAFKHTEGLSCTCRPLSEASRRLCSALPRLWTCSCCVGHPQAQWPKGKEKQATYLVPKFFGGRTHSTSPYFTEQSTRSPVTQGRQSGFILPCAWKVVSQGDLMNSARECHTHTGLHSKPHMLDKHVHSTAVHVTYCHVELFSKVTLRQRPNSSHSLVRLCVK